MMASFFNATTGLRRVDGKAMKLPRDLYAYL